MSSSRKLTGVSKASGGIAMKSKFICLIVAALMIATFGAVIQNASVDSADSGENTASAYGFNFWINYGDDNGWSGAFATEGYNACTALQSYASSSNLTLTIDSATYTVQYGYSYINQNYGDITTLGNMTENSTDKWNTIYYTVSGWTLGSDAIGYYKPFADYNADYQTANIALYYGTAAEAQAAISALPTTGLRSVVPITSIVGNADFAVRFYIKTDSTAVADAAAKGKVLSISGLPSVTATSLAAGQTIVGYGSDLYLALKNAVSSNISAVNDVPGVDYGTYMSYYSWMNSLFGLGTVLVDDMDDEDWSNDIYAWWTQYTVYSDDSNASNDVKSDFVLGYYSPLSNAPNVQTSYSLVYSEGTA